MSKQFESAEQNGRSSLISHLAASTALLAAAIVLLAVIFFQSMIHQFFNESFKSPLKEWSAMVATRISNDHKLAQAIAKNHKIGIVIQTKNDTVAFGTDGQTIDPKELLDPKHKFRQIQVYAHDGQAFTFLLDEKQFVDGHNSLLLWLLAMLLIIIGVVYAVQLSQLRPLKWLGSGVEAVARGDFSKRVPVVRKDEIGQVAQSFNLMVSKLEQMMDDRERLLADVSHELRSPLTRIKLAVELLPENTKNETIRKDIAEMESLITVLLEREKVKHQITVVQKERLDPAVIVKQVISSFKGGTPAIELKLRQKSLQFEGDPALIKVLMHNLIDNAVKFSLPDSGPIRVLLDLSSDRFELVVEDDGQGIPAEQIDKILEAFVKLNPARGHRQGYGLGLNLCQRIVQAHNGNIEIQSQGKRGTRVCVSLPA